MNPHRYDYPSRRKVVYSTRGMVCTSQPLAAEAGLDMLKKGGNAIDAAIATAITLTVTEPCSNALGSDTFALLWVKDSIYGINGSGYAPRGISREAVKAQSALIVLDSMDAAVIKSCANIPTAKTTQYNTLSVYDILNAEKLVMTVEAVKKLEEVYA